MKCNHWSHCQLSYHTV